MRKAEEQRVNMDAAKRTTEKLECFTRTEQRENKDAAKRRRIRKPSRSSKQTA